MVVTSGAMNSDTLSCTNVIESHGCSTRKLRYYIMTYSTCADVINAQWLSELEVWIMYSTSASFLLSSISPTHQMQCTSITHIALHSSLWPELSVWLSDFSRHVTMAGFGIHCLKFRPPSYFFFLFLGYSSYDWPQMYLCLHVPFFY